ncbi:protein HEG [Periophthalmus magnuspinnatus]|uniref:protein HEG n=1 Tax=Periophthalmus magnuspinnatus TaxID=409849 RepID=UPI0024365815|nr:protein HEG [Periophthalmus magnuspinnatus]
MSDSNNCSGLRSLENGQTFFRYRGLFVIFSCRHGYRLHGHKTNSCVSGRWSREPPICVGSGCPPPGPVAHGSFSVNSDSSWAEFSCDVGHKLIGPSALYCKGDEWSSPQPVCEESDLMHSHPFIVISQKPTVNWTLQATVDLKTKTPSHHITEATPKNTSLHFDITNSRTDGTKSDLLQQISTVTSEENQDMHNLSTTQKRFSKELLPAVTSLKTTTNEFSATFTTILKHDLTQAATVLPSFQILPTFNNPIIQNLPVSFNPVMTKTTKTPVPLSLSSTMSTLAKSYGTTANLKSTYGTTSPGLGITPNQNIKSSTISDNIWTTDPPVLLQFTLKDHNYHTTTTTTTPQNVATTFKSEESKIFSTTQTKKTEPSVSSPLCPDPPVPVNGAFYFGNKETAWPIEKQHIQYVCSPGFVLAKGDAVRYCQEGTAWSGITPICEDVDECVLPVAVTGCLFGCVNSPGSFHCLCPSGFTIQSPDAHCQDINECAPNSGMGPCSERCHNSPGSFHCSCSSGFTLAADGLTCISECPNGYRKQPNNSTLPPTGQCVDINECEHREWCEWKCVNLPGSYRCICPRGFTLAQDGRRCRDINECSDKNGGCSHLCINRRGTFKCSCPRSHRLSTYSWSKCVPRISTV